MTDRLTPDLFMLRYWNGVKDLLRWILCTWSKWNLTKEAIASDEPAEAQTRIVQRRWDCITHCSVPAIRETDWKQHKSWTNHQNPQISKSQSLRYDQPKVFVNLSHQLKRQVGLSAMVSALGSLKAPWVQTSEELQSFMFGKMVYQYILYIDCLFYRKGLQKWPSFNNFPGSCFLRIFFCFCFDVLCQLPVSVPRKYQPLRSSHHGKAILQSLKGRCFAAVCDLSCLRVMMTWLPGRSPLGAHAHKTCWTWL